MVITSTFLVAFGTWLGGKVVDKGFNKITDSLLSIDEKNKFYKIAARIKDEFLADVNATKKDLVRMRDLTNQLAEMASDSRQDSLRTELRGMEEVGSEAAAKIENKVEKMVELDEKRKELLAEVARFNSWLDEKKAELMQLENSDLTPEERSLKAVVSKPTNNKMIFYFKTILLVL